MIKVGIAVLLMACIVFPLCGQDAVRLLDPSDVELFLESFPRVHQQLGDLDLDLDDTAGAVTISDAIFASEKAKDVFRANGWSEDYLPRVQCILKGTTLLVVENRLMVASPELQESLNEIDSMQTGPYFTADMKAAMRDQLLMAIHMMDESLSEEMATIHVADMDLIRIHKYALAALIAPDVAF